MCAHYETLIGRLTAGTSAVELVHVPHARWPLAPPSALTRTPDGPRIAVLDSSFNPPTLAHRALARASPPHDAGAAFDARLLLLSVRNADKALKPTDATYAQRLHMMVLLAQDIAAAPQAAGGPDGRDNVAVAIVDEPTFVGKSRVLRAFLHARVTRLRSADADAAEHPPPRPQLTFLVGIDTLERILSPRFYPSEPSMRAALRRFLSPDGDDARLVCARRVTPGLALPPDERERDVWRTAREYVDPRRITMVDLGEAVRAHSSSEVRARIASRLPWRDMVIDDVAAFIEKEHLYSGGDSPAGASQ